MSNTKAFDTIRSSTLGEGLTDDEVRALAHIADVRSLADGECLAVEGDEDTYLYVIITGSLVVMKKTPRGRQEILCRLTNHEIAGIAGFVEHQTRLASMHAGGPTEVIAISRKNFQTLIKTNPEAVYKVMCALVREGMKIVKQLDDGIIELSQCFEEINARY